MTVELAGGGVYRCVLWDTFLERVVVVWEAAARHLEVVVSRRQHLRLDLRGALSARQNPATRRRRRRFSELPSFIAGLRIQWFPQSPLAARRQIITTGEALHRDGVCRRRHAPRPHPLTGQRQRQQRRRRRRRAAARGHRVARVCAGEGFCACGERRRQQQQWTMQCHTRNSHLSRATHIHTSHISHSILHKQKVLLGLWEMDTHNHTFPHDAITCVSKYSTQHTTTQTHHDIQRCSSVFGRCTRAAPSTATSSRPTCCSS